MSEQTPQMEEKLKECERILWRTLPLVMHASRSLAREDFADGQSLTPGQYHTLRNIHRGAKSVSDLAACGKISPPAASRHVDELVKLGLLERARDPEDRRSIILALTDEGRSKWNKMVERYHRLFSERMKDLSNEELETIIKGFELLHNAFSDTPIEHDCLVNGGLHHDE